MEMWELNNANYYVNMYEWEKLGHYEDTTGNLDYDIEGRWSDNTYNVSIVSSEEW